MAASRPGNPDRGWNDPPMFLYKTENQSALQTPKKSALTQRVGMPQNYISPTKKPTDSTGKTTLLPTSSLSQKQRSPLSGPSSGPPFSGPPPSGPPPSGPPPSGPPPYSTPHSSRNTAPQCGPLSSGLITLVKTTSSVSPEDTEELPVDSCETTLTKLNLVLKICQEKIQKRVVDDITKKLSLLQDSWLKDTLSMPVKLRMCKLAAALANQKYDVANEIHLSLMVDYVAEVSQWMVGIKRLIYEAQKHLSLLETKHTNNDKQQSEEEINLSTFKTLSVADTICNSQCETTQPSDGDISCDNVEKEDFRVKERIESDVSGKNEVTSVADAKDIDKKNKDP